MKRRLEEAFEPPVLQKEKSEVTVMNFAEETPKREMVESMVEVSIEPMSIVRSSD